MTQPCDLVSTTCRRWFTAEQKCQLWQAVQFNRHDMPRNTLRKVLFHFLTAARISPHSDGEFPKTFSPVRGTHRIWRCVLIPLIASPVVNWSLKQQLSQSQSFEYFEKANTGLSFYKNTELLAVEGIKDFICWLWLTFALVNSVTNRKIIQ